MSDPQPPARATAADLLERFDAWCRATEYARTTTRPMDAGEQMAQRDAHDLLSDAFAALSRVRALVEPVTSDLRSAADHAEQRYQKYPETPHYALITAVRLLAWADELAAAMDGKE